MSQPVHGDLGRPIRVVIFCGPFLEPAAYEFFHRLARHEEIELVGGFRETATSETFLAWAADLRRRRGVLALPMLSLRLLSAARERFLHPLRSRRRRRLKAWATETIESVPDLHAADVLHRVETLEPDLGVVYGGPILRPELFELPALGTLGIHHGTLPTYRGKKTTFWEMYHGEPDAGITIQKINQGVDTGCVVRFGRVPIGRRRYGTVWSEVQERGVELYLDAVLDMKRGSATLSEPTGLRRKLFRDPKPQQILTLWWRQFSGSFPSPRDESQ